MQKNIFLSLKIIYFWNKNIYMFIFGILSTPLPYFLFAFAYLMGISMGLFHHNDKISSDEEFTSNIINYEELNPVVELSLTDAHYHDFLQTETSSKTLMAGFCHFLISFDHFNTYSPPREEVLKYNYIPISNLFSRPPPVLS